MQQLMVLVIASSTGKNKILCKQMSNKNLRVSNPLMVYETYK